MPHFDLKELLMTVGYIGVFIIIFAESGLLIGFFLPGDSLLFTAGFLASVGFFNLPLLILLIVVAAITGDQSLNVQEDVTDAESLAHLVAIVLQVNLEIKQRLLAAPTLAEMLAMERQLLETETAILRYMQQTRPTAGASGPTPN